MKEGHSKFRYLRRYSAVNLKATFDGATKLHEREEEWFLCTTLQIILLNLPCCFISQKDSSNVKRFNSKSASKFSSMCLDSWYCCFSIQIAKYRASSVTIGRLAVPRLRKSAVVLIKLRFGFSSRLVYVGFLTKGTKTGFFPRTSGCPCQYRHTKSS